MQHHRSSQLARSAGELVTVSPLFSYLKGIVAKRVAFGVLCLLPFIYESGFAMKFLVHLFVLLLVVASVGCGANEEAVKTYDVSDVEQLLIDHPELADPPPPEFRVED
ncbi:hypothetical protein [Novipirellula aureliae]|nr:hypothetical protein [Novipirellula aureliae]